MHQRGKLLRTSRILPATLKSSNKTSVVLFRLAVESSFYNQDSVLRKKSNQPKELNIYKVKVETLVVLFKHILKLHRIIAKNENLIDLNENAC